ncbi:uncharacterized protein LOC142342527 isoform X3 [Convolutriloba macropyga]
MTSETPASLVGCGPNSIPIGTCLAEALEKDPAFAATLLPMLDKCVKEGKKEALVSTLTDLADEESKPQDPEVFYREYEYIWTISNFSQIRFLPKGLGFMAPFFHTMSGIEGTADAEWSWGVTPSNNNTAKDHFLALFVRLRNFHEFRDHAKTKKITANATFRMYDKDLNVLFEEKPRKGIDIDNWVTRDGLNCVNFVPHKILDQMLANDENNDTLVFGVSLKVKINHEITELQMKKKTIEYTTQAAVDKFCFQHRIENYLEIERSDDYNLAANFLQQLPTGKIAEWEATYVKSLDGRFGTKMKLLNGEEFKNCEIVSGSHFMVLCAGATPGEEGEEGEGGEDGGVPQGVKKVTDVKSKIAAQEGQRMRDDWNLSTVADGWGRRNLIQDDEIQKRKDEILDPYGALVINFTMYLNTSTHDRKEGKTGLGKASLDGGKSKSGHKKKIMLSYNWGTKETVHKIKDALESWGYDTWIDDNQMGDNVMLSMAEGVFNSDAVLICLTDNYQNSFNCQREASMTFDERKPMIPLKLEPGVDWKPWVKLLISGKRYIEMDRSPSFDDFMAELKTYLERMDELK